MERPLVIGIAGGTGAGKSCLTEFLRKKYARGGVAVLDMDSYYRDPGCSDPRDRENFNYDHPSAIDHDLLLASVDRLIAGLPTQKPCYCFASHCRTDRFSTVLPASLVIVEGIFALWDARLRDRMDLGIYVDAPADLRFIRRAQRDVHERGRTFESVAKQYLQTVRPMHETYIEPTKAYADLVVENKDSIESMVCTLEHLPALGFSQPGGMPWAAIQ